MLQIIFCDVLPIFFLLNRWRMAHIRFWSPSSFIFTQGNSMNLPRPYWAFILILRQKDSMNELSTPKNHWIIFYGQSKPYFWRKWARNHKNDSGAPLVFHFWTKRLRKRAQRPEKPLYGKFWERRNEFPAQSVALSLPESLRVLCVEKPRTPLLIWAWPLPTPFGPTLWPKSPTYCVFHAPVKITYEYHFKSFAVCVWLCRLHALCHERFFFFWVIANALIEPQSYRAATALKFVAHKIKANIDRNRFIRLPDRMRVPWLI